MKKILIALDYDPTAQKVAEIGYGIAKAMNAQPVLLHVITDVTQYSYLDYLDISDYILPEISLQNLPAFRRKFTTVSAWVVNISVQSLPPVAGFTDNTAQSLPLSSRDRLLAFIHGFVLLEKH